MRIYMPAANETRQQRQQAIRQILASRPVDRQSELVRLLRERGISATQSSVSRDLRQLGIAKLGSGYAEAAADTPTDNPVPPEDFVRGIVTAGPHLTVVRTAVGAAARVAVFLDRSGWPEIVGTISGDDTIFIATASMAGQRRLIARMHAHFGS